MSEMQIHWQEIVMEDSIYARDKMDHANIEILCQKLLAGIELEPIEVQRVTGYKPKEAENDETILLINGGHRIEAYKQYNTIVLAAQKAQKEKDEEVEYADLEVKTPRITFYKECVLEYERSKSELLARAHEANDEQGLNNRLQDTKKAARNLALFNPEWSQETIANALNRKRPTITPYISDIFQKRRATVQSRIMRLSQLGWTQEMIGNRLGKDQSVVSRNMQNVDANKMHNFFSQGKSVDEIASIYSLDVQTTWSLLFHAMAENGDDITDNTRFELLNEAIKGVDLTVEAFDRHKIYPEPMELCGINEYKGRIPGQIVLQVLYFFTEPGDRVADPMVGGGTTLDACLLMNRKCYGFDLYSHKDRIDVIPFNICASERHYQRKIRPLKKVQLCFLDPPYYKKMADEYKLPKKQRSKEGFMEFASNWGRFCDAILEEKGIVALLMSSYVDYEDAEESIFAHDYLGDFERRGYSVLYDGSADLPTETYSASDVKNARQLRQWLTIRRALYVLRKDS